MIFLEIVKIPNAVDVMNIRIDIILPSKVGSEKISITRIKIDRIIVESFL